MPVSVPLVLKHKIRKDSRSFHDVSILVDVFPFQPRRIGLTRLVNSQWNLETAVGGRPEYHGKKSHGKRKQNKTKK